MLKKIFPLAVIPTIIYSQVVFEPVSSTVYNFLNRLSIKGVIIFNDELSPLSRLTIAKKLLEAEDTIEMLTAIERDELFYYKKDYFPEIEIIHSKSDSSSRKNSKKTVFFRDDNNTGFRPFLYMDKNFSISADPILGFSYRRQYDDNYNLRFNGFGFSGYFHNAGFNFYFRDNGESGKSIDYEKRITREPGIVPHKSEEEFLDYSYVRGMVSYSWEWGSFDFGKDYIEWGSGRGGKLILSNKAPSFPFIRLIVNPADWIQFQYIHGWLYSGVIDSNSIRETLVEGRESYYQIDKFIASHIFSLYPFDNFSFSVGESIIYSDKIEPLYLIPVIFFRFADHYNSGDANSGDNAQIFVNTVYKYSPLRVKLYGTFFIDELSISDLFNGGNLSSVGLTLGLNFVDPLIKNSELVAEYSRIDPFVYMNSNDAQLYTSHGYQLGHWVGSNANQFYFSYKQWITRGLSIDIWGEFIKKGQTELPEQQYQKPYPDILYGPNLTIKKAGFEISYETLRKLFVRLFYNYSEITDEEEGRTQEFKLGSNNIFGFLLSYGM